MLTITTVSSIPDDDLAKAWLQHLRDFDTAHPGCHFQIAISAPDMPTSEAVKALEAIDPPLDTFATKWK